IRRSGGVLRVEVADDGVGGADAANGSGLTGLADRVAALGGTLSVASPPGAGTLVTAAVPCGAFWSSRRAPPRGPGYGWWSPTIPGSSVRACARCSPALD